MPSIAVIAGDGVGKEVIPAGLRVLGAVASLDVEILPWGSEYYAKTGPVISALRAQARARTSEKKGEGSR